MTRPTSLKQRSEPQPIVLVPPVDHDDVPILGLRREAAAKSLGISARKLDELTAGGLIPSVKLGAVRLYPVAELVRWLAERAKGGDR